MVKTLGLDSRIGIYGNQKDIETAERAMVENDANLSILDEPLARLAIQSLIDEHNLKASILINGNSVWSRDRITRDVRKVIKNGMQAMTDYLYSWLHLQAGSICHYNKRGWIDTYPTINHLRKFFLQNEYGKRVKDNLMGRFTDSYLIACEVEQILGI